MNSLLPGAKPHQPVCCAHCQHQFPQDPPFEVPCPVCHAPAGSYCRRPSEHSGPFVPFHAKRDVQALKEGHYDHNGMHQCGPNSDTEEAQKIWKRFKC